MATRRSGAANAQSQTDKTNGKETTKAQSTRQQGQKETTTKSRSTKAAPVNVTFNVRIPENMGKGKRTVFLAGNFSQINNKMEDWSAQGQKMKKGDDGRWTLTIKVPQNSVIEYKYTLGDWDTVEVDQNCQDVGNRRLQVGSGDIQQIEDSVHRFRGVDPCG